MAVQLGVRARLTKFELQGFYTLSEAEGNVLAGAARGDRYPSAFMSGLGVGN